MITIFVAEHMQSLNNVLAISAGQNKQPLLPWSRRLAVQLVGQLFGEWLAHFQPRDGAPSVIYSPSVRRHLESARLCFGMTGIEIIVDARLNPAEFGELEGTSPAERARFGGPKGFIERRYPGGECYNDVADRYRSFLRQVHRERDGQVILIGGAAGTTRQMLAHCCYGLPLADVLDRKKFFLPDARLPDGRHPAAAPYFYPSPLAGAPPEGALPEGTPLADP